MTTLAHGAATIVPLTGLVNDWVSAYKPDVVVDDLRELALGGTTFELVPVTGGETEDAMLIHVPELSVLFQPLENT